MGLSDALRRAGTGLVRGLVRDGYFWRSRVRRWLPQNSLTTLLHAKLGFFLFSQRNLSCGLSRYHVVAGSFADSIECMAD